MSDDHPVLALLAWVAGGLAVIGLVVLVGWQAGWWFNVQNAKRQGQIINIEAHNTRQSYGNQQTLREQITQNVQNVLQVSTQIAESRDPGEVAALKAQRKAIVNIVCQDADQVTGDPLPPGQQQFVKINCEAGSVSPSSTYYG